jgi:hypothetical protein
MPAGRTNAAESREHEAFRHAISVTVGERGQSREGEGCPPSGIPRVSNGWGGLFSENGVSTRAECLSEARLWRKAEPGSSLKRSAIFLGKYESLGVTRRVAEHSELTNSRYQSSDASARTESPNFRSAPQSHGSCGENQINIHTFGTGRP